MAKKIDNSAAAPSGESPTENAPRNPNYGKGIFRRRIRLSKGEGFVKGELEDSSHAFKTTLHYDQSGITDVTAEAIRYPMTTCPGAVVPLRDFIGLPLDLVAVDVARRTKPRIQCTHLFDLTVLAYSHIMRDEQQRVYDIELPDEDAEGNPRVLKVFKDGELLIEWLVSEWRIIEPESLAGNSLHTGFSKWLEKVYADDEEKKEFAWLAQKGYLVSQARVFDVNKLAGTRKFVGPHMVGICHTYSEEQMKTAHHSYNSFIDFSDDAESLLQFKSLD